MWSALDSFVICTSFMAMNFIEDFRKEERGVAPLVATILLIVIVVSLCAMFQEKIVAWFEDMWDIVLGGSSGIG